MNQQLVKILCFAFAEYARIEAMKAANQARIARDETIAYPEEEFNNSASALDHLAMEAANL